MNWPMLPKPDLGAPCNSCGMCCLREQCPVSLAVFGEQAVCPALRQDPPRLTCGMMANAAAYMNTPPWTDEPLSHAFRLLISAGTGCDAGDFNAPEAAGVDDRISEIAAARISDAPEEVQALVKLFAGMCA